MNLPTVPLGELCDMDRQGLHPDDPSALDLPFVGVEHVESESGTFNFNNDSRVGSQKSTTFRFDERHVLYAKLRPYLNKVATPGFSGRCSTELVPLLPRDGVDREFIAYLLRRRETVDYVMASVTGARMPRTDMRALLSLPVPLPPLDQQRRIVGILNRAAKIERLRVRAQERLREFIPALFVRMFGDPVENPHGWDVALLGEVIEGLQAGKNVKAGTRASRLKILKVSAVTEGEFDPSMSKPSPHNYVAPSHHHVHVGDLLISRANGTPAYVGATAMVEHEVTGVLLPDKLLRFVWREDSLVEPRYVHGLLQTPAMRKVIREMASGISMKNISQAKLKTLPVLVPPLDLQRHYTQLVETARSTASIAKSASRTVSKLSASLMSRVLEANA